MDFDQNKSDDQKKMKYFQLKKLIVVLIAAVAGITLIVLALTVIGVRDNDDAPSQDNAEQVEQANQPTIAITENGFEPAEILVSPGATVRWVNQTNEPHVIASNPFPENDAHTELNAEKPIGPDESFEVTLGEEVISYDYHDDYNPQFNGRITVIE